jgi:hypothetical protein
VEYTICQLPWILEAGTTPPPNERTSDRAATAERRWLSPLVIGTSRRANGGVVIDRGPIEATSTPESHLVERILVLPRGADDVETRVFTSGAEDIRVLGVEFVRWSTEEPAVAANGPPLRSLLPSF